MAAAATSTAIPILNDTLGRCGRVRPRRGTWPLPKGRAQLPHTSRPASPRSAFTDQLPQWGQAMTTGQGRRPTRLRKPALNKIGHRAGDAGLHG